MSKITKKGLAILLVVAMLFSILPTAAFAGTANGNLWLRDKLTDGYYQFNGSRWYFVNKEPASGYIHWDSQTTTLTLNNIQYTGEGYALTVDSQKVGLAIYYDGSDALTLNLIGTNTVTHPGGNAYVLSCGIYSAGSINVSGTGSLTANGGDDGIYAEDGITLTGGTLAGSCGEAVTWTLDANGTLTISGTGAMDDYEYQDTPWYSARDSIKTIDIKKGVTTIGDYAFGECSNLASVTIPDSVITIGNSAFLNCKNLAGVTIPKSVNEIGPYAFARCTNLISVIIPDSVTVISSSVFDNCSNLESVTIPDSVTRIEDGAFLGCTSLISVNIPNSVTSIGSGAFRGSGLTSVTIPGTVTEIGYAAFVGCSSLEQVIYLGIDGPCVVYPFFIENAEPFHGISPTITVPADYKDSEFCEIALIDDNKSTNYSVMITKPTGGKISVKNPLVTSGSTITLTITPEQCYVYDSDSLTVTDTADKPITVTNNTFTMPNSSVTVTAKFTLNHTGGEATCKSQAICGVCEKAYGELNSNNHEKSAEWVSVSATAHQQVYSCCNTPVTEEEAHEYGSDSQCDKCWYTKPSSSTSTGSSSGGGFSGVYNYPVTASNVDGADVSFSDNYAVAGETVTITVTPESGKQVDEVIITDADGKVITVTKVGDNQYSFTMPAGKVNVAVTTADANYDLRIVMQINNRNILVNSKTIVNDVAPVIVGDRTMVPIRVVTETLGGTADWNADTRTVTLHIDGKTMTMTIGEIIDGFDVAPVILNNRTYVSIRYVAEKLGANVQWMAATQQIIIEQ